MTDLISSFSPGLSPLLKGGRVQKGYIDGWATSMRRDNQNDRLFQDRIDKEPFIGGLAKGEDGIVGPITVEHPLGVFNTIGEPAEVIKGETEDGTPAHRLISKLFIEDDELAAGMWQKCVTLKKASKRVRPGYSVEGKVLERASNDPKDPLYHDILAWRWDGTVITMKPRNRDAFFEAVMQSMTRMPGGLDIVKATAAEFGSDFALGAIARGEGEEAEELELAKACASFGLNIFDLAAADVVRAQNPRAWAQVLAKLMTKVSGAAA